MAMTVLFNLLNNLLKSGRHCHRIRQCILLSTSSSKTPLRKAVFDDPKYRFREDHIPRQSDVVVIGGGVIGLAVAYWIRLISKTTVTVIERDPSMTKASSILGLGTVRTQFSEAESIQMSLLASEFLRNIELNLSASNDEKAAVNFVPHGNLMLTDKEGANQLHENHLLQSALKVPSIIMQPVDVAKRWPWINVDDVSLASYGERREGWFDPWMLIRHLRNKCHTLGVNYVIGNVVGFTLYKHVYTTHFLDRPLRPAIMGPRISDVLVSTPGGDIVNIAFHTAVNAAGPWAAGIVSMAMANVDETIIPLPVEKRKQNIFVIRPDYSRSSTIFPGIDAPIILDNSGLFFHRQGLSGDFTVCMNPNMPLKDKAVSVSDSLDVDYSVFHEKIQPILARRIPAMANSTIQSAWACFNDYNPKDQSLIVGPHPFHQNLMLANGSSGLGIQHSIAIGRALAEYIHYRHYKSIDLTRFSFDRFYLDLPMQDRSIF